MKRLGYILAGILVVVGAALIVASCGGGATDGTEAVNNCWECHSDEALLMEVADTEEEPVSELISGEC